MENVSADFTINENQPLQAEYTLGESEHFDCTFELFASGTVWGSIDGNIENQTDLWEILNSKADTETVNHDLEVIEGEISDLSYTVDNNYTTLVNRFENDELAISNNANEITSINNTILTYGDIVTYDASNFATSEQGALANTALQPNDNISELVNNVGYITSASLPTLEDLTTQAQMDAINSGATTAKINQIASNTQAISTETENRQNADNNLQSQIDAITASSDVTDIVGTYAQLQAYDTSTLPPNSIIKVLQDEHQNNETTYYRWVITGGVGSWVLIGEEGPYYTKSEADGRFVPQTRTVNGKALSTNITLDASDVGALPSSTVIPVVDQTFDGTSANAQSGIAIAGAKFLQNTATSNNSITVNGTATAKSQAINIGTGSQATGNYGTALGAYSFGNASHALGLGNYAKATADYAIQLNKGTNNTSNSLCVGFNSDNYQLLDGTTGLIPDARISTNIARSSDIPTNTSDLTNDSGFITGITSSDVTTALGYTPYNSTNPNGYTSNVGTVTSVNNTQPDANGNVTIPTGGTVDQTYNPNSTNAQSGKAINGAKFVQNYASDWENLNILGQAPDVVSGIGNINIGTDSLANGYYGVAIGYHSRIGEEGVNTGYSDAIAIGEYSNCLADSTIQLGGGYNSTANTLQVRSYTLLNTSTGLIPDARISSNIARTSAIPTESTVSGWGFTKNTGTVTSVNNVSPVSGNVTLSIPTATSDLTNDSGFITSSDLPTNYVTTDTTQDITGTKTFIGQKKIAFKQSGTSDKLGFTLYNNSGTEKGYLEYNPSNNVDGVPLMTLGNYATASGGLTHVGFRKYSSISGASGAYNLLTPLISDAKTPFNLTTTYTNFYLPLGFTDGTTTVKTAKSGMVDLSSLLSGYVTSSAIANMQTTNNLVTSVSSSSTNNQYPSAKCVYDLIGDIETLLQAV